jgi:lipopolysaccharide/colanic/teichoic acid biosynthesis glycosyltransferase
VELRDYIRVLRKGWTLVIGAILLGVSKPGVAGLCQTGGRSCSLWREADRLGLFYVKRWPLAIELAIPTRAIGANIKTGGVE